MVYKQHLAALLKKEKISDDDYEDVEPDHKEILQEEATKTDTEAYLACLFLVMADDERYGGVKMALHNNYLLGK